VERCVLIVDCEAAVQAALGRALRACGLDVLRARDPATARAVLEERRPCMVIASDTLPESGAIDLLERVRAEDPTVLRVLLCARPEGTRLREAVRRAEPDWLLARPWAPGSVAAMYAACLGSAPSGAAGTRPGAAPAVGRGARAGLTAAARPETEARTERARAARDEAWTAFAGCDDVPALLACVGRAWTRLGPLRECWWVDAAAQTLLPLAGGSAPLSERPLRDLDPGARALVEAALPASSPTLVEGEVVDADGEPRKTALLAAPVVRRGERLGVLALVAGHRESLPAAACAWLGSLVGPFGAALERIRLARLLAEEKTLWEAAFDAIADPVLLLDATAQVIRANRAARTLRPGGAPDPEANGAHAWACGQASAHPAWACPLQRESLLREPARLELADLFGRAGQTFEVVSFPLAIAPGTPPRRIQIHRDVTPLRRLGAALRRGEELSVVASLAAGVAHEIRNPLAAMTQAASLLRARRALDVDDRQLVEVLLDETRRMSRIVGEFLAFARPSSGDFAPHDIAELVSGTAALLRRDPVLRPGVEIGLHVTPDLPRLRIDADKIRQVLWNLLRNAAEAVPAGGRIRVAIAPLRDGGRDGVRVSVEDDGPGVAQADRQRVFLPFETTKPGGTGLGLALARHIAALHDGWVRLDERAGEGACFGLWLPVRGPSPEPDGEVGAGTGRGGEA